jgi:hypothetical protein
METVTRNIVRYLTQQGLIDRKSVVDGGLTVAMSRSRNRFVRVKQRSGPGYFIKQALASEPMTAETVRREAEIYRGAFGDDRLASLRGLLPNFHHFDESQNILVIDLVDDAESVAECHGRLQRCPADLGRRLGAAIAAYHQIRFEPGKPQAALFPQKPPWIFDLHTQPDVSHLRRSPAASGLTDLLLGTPGLAARLAAARAEWAHDTLIHTDMKWQNCLLAPRKAPLAEQRLLIVDWELADIGDAAWDVGGILQAYLVFWIGSIPADRRGTPEELAASAASPIETVQPAIAALWDAYIGASAVHGAAPEAFLLRCVRMMAARMLVTAYEMSINVTEGDPRLLLLLQTAFNVFEHPAEAGEHLLGIRSRAKPPLGPLPQPGSLPSMTGPANAAAVRSRHGG